jgi:uncharacterized RDD family membrane protein YckC
LTTAEACHWPYVDHVDFEDRHVTVTPEGISLDLVLAGLGSRFAAFALDFVVQSVALIIFGIVVLSAFHGGASESSGLVAGGVVSLFVLVDFIGYFVFCEMLFGGRTIGKRAAGLRVVRFSGQPVGFWSSLLRNIVRLIDMQLGVLYLVGAVLILSTDKNQRLGDLLAGTIVVRDRVGAAAAWKDTSWSSPAGFTTASWSQSSRPPLGPQQLALPPELAHWDVSAVPDSEIALVKAFLANRGGYTSQARARIGYDLTARIWPLVAGPTGPMPQEWFLEAVLVVKSARS